MLRRAEELEVARRRLGPPPDDDCSEATTQIRIRLLNGTQVQRRFLASSSLQALFDLVDTSAAPAPLGVVEAEVTEPTPYVLRLQFPATEFVRPSSTAEAPTLQALGLCPNALLLAEEQAMATARTTNQAIPTNQPGSAAGACDPSNQAATAAAAAAAEVGKRTIAQTVSGQAAPRARDRKRTRVEAANIPLKDEYPPKPAADVVELLSSDDEGGESAASVTATTACWTCNVCTYAGNSAAAQRCQICGNSRD